MRPRLRIPRVLAVAVLSAGAASAVNACGDEGDECIRCLPDPRIGDAGIGDGGEEPPVCPVCLPKDGVCGPGCIPEGFA
jgi:hypothetical protein